MNEIWKDIEGYEGLYQISNLGRVKRLDRYVKGRWGNYYLLNGKLIKERKTKDGYLRVGLQTGKKQKMFAIHRLVAKAFIPNPDNLPQVNHKDENKENNCVDNLEWCTAKYNINYGNCIEYRSKKRINGKNSKTVYQYSIDGQFIKEWPSTREIQRSLGFAKSNIVTCCNGKIKTAYGYKWSYTKL